MSSGPKTTPRFLQRLANTGHIYLGWGDGGEGYLLPCSLPTSVPDGHQGKQGAASPSGPCFTEFSSGIQAGQTISGNNIFLNFISMPLRNEKPGLETLAVFHITHRIHAHLTPGGGLKTEKMRRD